MFKKLLTFLACIIPFSACSVNFLRGEFSYIDHHIALKDLIKSEWHFKKTGINPYRDNNSEEDYIPNYIVSIYPDDKRHSLFPEETYLFEIIDEDLRNDEKFLLTLFNSPCNAKIMTSNSIEHYQPNGLGFSFIRMKNIIRCRKGYYKLEKINENSFVIKY